MQRIATKALVVAALALVGSWPGLANSGPLVVLQPVQTDQQAVRFDRGHYVIDTANSHAAVQIRSAIDDHGNVAFDVGILNLGAAPINIDVGDIRVDGTKDPVHVLTRREIEHKAENHARWTKFWTRLGTSLAAAGEANQRDYYNASTVTPYGIYNSTISVPCSGCQAAAVYTLAAGSARIAQIQATLDQTKARLGEQAFQLTTIAPRQSYMGRISLTHFRHGSGDSFRLIVNVDGESFAFAFRYVPDGTPAPAYRSVGPAMPPLPSSAGTIPVPVRLQPLPPASPTTQPATVILAASVQPTQLPQSRSRASTNVAIEQDWHRYYAALVTNGVTRSQAKTMADEQFGPID